MKYVLVYGQTGRYLYRADIDKDISSGKIAFNSCQRKWGNISLQEKVNVEPFTIDPRNQSIGVCELSIDFFRNKSNASDPLDADALAQAFQQQFRDTPFTIDQPLLFKHKGMFSIQVKALTGRAITAGSSSGFTNIINPNWNFEQMGIGGLDKEFSAIFRRTFASRMFPPAIGKQLGLKHVRGILLHGPPGTGKTLMARQIGNMLNAREPKIVNGPSILDKYVGESEANIRKLFADAEEEEKRLGPNSALHIIIFDEIDAICKTRGSTPNSGVHDTVVNQLLTKMDGVEQLNNVLIIGMTNRRDMIDEALLRPGRFEMQMEISLPDEDGRLQIFNIHTSKMRKAGKLGRDVDLRELAFKTKNFSGAEIEGLCRAATNTSMYQLIDTKSGDTKIDPSTIDRLVIKRSDFLYSLENDVKPLFGTADEELSVYAPRGIIMWGDTVSEALKMGQLAVRTVNDASVERMRPLTLLLEGSPKAGKTALAVEIAKQSKFPFIKIVSSHKMIGFTEVAKCLAMKKIFDDGAKSPLSIIIVDNIEGLIEYNPVGPRFSSCLTQAIHDLVTMPLKADRRMLIIATTSCREALAEQNLTRAFSWTVRVQMMTQPQHILTALQEDDRFTERERSLMEHSLSQQRIFIGIKHLIDLIDLSVKADPEQRLATFLAKLEDDSQRSY